MARVTKYDVFVSYSREDACDIAKRLYDALLQTKIRVYLDKGIRVSDSSTALRDKIKKSKIAVVIFSPLYGESISRWDELLHILECKELYGITAMLMSHELVPTKVQIQLQRIPEKFYKGLLSKWKSDAYWSDVLTTLNSLPGWHNPPLLWSDDEIDSMVRDIKKCIRDKYGDSSCSPEYDVFLSFNSEGSSHRFSSHLYAALRRKGIMTTCYSDFKRGHEISHEIVNAIQESKLYIIIFSEDYISSSCCSDELNLVAECSDKLKRFVVPVFYNVDPQSFQSQLKDHQFQRCLIENKEHFRKDSGSDSDSETVHISNFVMSWDSKEIKPESKLIERIVGDIIRKLERKSSIDINSLVGISERVNSVNSILDSGSTEVRIVGIEGMAGTGKSTLAKALFDQLSIRFEASCFLANIRESWQRGRKRYLQNKLVTELSRGSDIMFYKDGLKCKKVLIVLDDIWEAEQFELLIGDRDQYGNGTRIVITSRDNGSLKYADVLYKMTELSVRESRLLFELNAFRTNYYSAESDHLSSAIVDNISKRNPLALKVLGSVLCGKDSKTWENVLRQLQKVSSDEIQNVLRICYDQLEEEQKGVFLDIACFFKGEEEALTKRILDGCMTAEAVEDLVDMSLITIQDSKLWMSDFVEDMAKKIVQEQSIEEPGGRSRLWDPEDIRRVLKSGLGGGTVETLLLDMSKIKSVEVEHSAFYRLLNLRMLKLHSHFANCTLQFPDNDTILLPRELRYLYWDACPFKSLHFSFLSTIYLVEIRLQFSKVERLWRTYQNFPYLKVIDLSFSKQLVEIPNLSRALNVESVSLRGCVSLREVPTYFCSLKKLISLNLEDCTSLEEVKALPQNIINVNLARCNKLHTLPSNISDLNSLTCIELIGCSDLSSQKI